MKQLALYTTLLLLISAIAIISCNKKSETTKPTTEVTESQKMIDYMITKWGYKKEDIKEMADRFVIQGDMAILKKGFWAGYAKTNDPTARHYRDANLVTATNVIYIEFSSSVPTDWKNAYREAMSRWNALNLRISFQEACSTHEILVKYGTVSESYYIAETNLPNGSGYAGTVSTINSTYGPSSYSEKLNSAIHELGHAIGFRHTDNPADSYCVAITTATTSCNTTTDPSSVMQPPVKAFTGFTSCDIAAFTTIYKK